jgi:nitrate/nitrite-specific signal transduction histidine kinase
MNHNVERSSNAAFGETPSAGDSADRKTGRLRRFLRRGDEQVPWEQEIRTGELRQMPAPSLSNHVQSRVLNLVHRAINDCLVLLQGLRSPSIPSTRLERALSEFLDEIGRSAGPQFRFVVTGRPKTLSSTIQEQIYLIGREAIVNALRHSEATSIETELEYLSRSLRVMIRDDGCGIESRTLSSGCDSDCGLRGMVERARAIGAQFQIWSKPGSGTEVELYLPLDSRSIPALIH